MRRRRLLKLGFGAAALLAVVGSGIALVRPGVVAGRLTPEADAVFAAVARAVLDKSLPNQAGQRGAALEIHLSHMNALIGALPEPTQVELSHLLALLVSAPGRTFVAGLGTKWADADTAEIQACLERMRMSSVRSRQQVYHALRDLTNAAFYAYPSAWPLMGYPGPVAV
jgi:hypothetical protein